MCVCTHTHKRSNSNMNAQIHTLYWVCVGWTHSLSQLTTHQKMGQRYCRISSGNLVSPSQCFNYCRESETAQIETRDEILPSHLSKIETTQVGSGGQNKIRTWVSDTAGHLMTVCKYLSTIMYSSSSRNWNTQLMVFQFRIMSSVGRRRPHWLNIDRYQKLVWVSLPHSDSCTPSHYKTCDSRAKCNLNKWETSFSLTHNLLLTQLCRGPSHSNCDQR
jgi:hypothetical protein